MTKTTRQFNNILKYTVPQFKKTKQKKPHIYGIPRYFREVFGCGVFIKLHVQKHGTH